MQPRILTVLFLFFSIWSQAQQPGMARAPLTKSARLLSNQQLLAEDCSNGKDDNGNGLIDCEDFSCYFQKVPASCNCVPSNTLWTANGQGELYWANTATGVEKYVGAMGAALSDLAWTHDGKLYGIDLSGRVYEVNPGTAALTPLFTITSIGSTNAMTSDVDGNLYIAGGPNIIKYSRINGAISQVADLTSLGVFSSGDLAFSGGMLYLSCLGNQIAKINVATKKADVKTITGLPFNANIYGIVSSADGSLYLSGTTDIYKLNPVTMKADLFYVYKSMIHPIWGLANYNDNCNAPPPECKAELTIAMETPTPHCAATGVKLAASSTGVTGTPGYQWQMPDGTVANETEIKATKTGWYKVQLSTADPFCNDEDSVFVDLLPAPVAHLGQDTVLCVGAQFLRQNGAQTHASFEYLWQDGSTAPFFTVQQDGKYWLRISNACGTASDTFLVASLQLPEVALGPDRAVCAEDTVQLSNSLHQQGYQYSWSNGQTGPAIVVAQPGPLQVRVSNVCGAVTGEIVITEKEEGCDCHLFVPNAFTPNGDGRNDVFKVLADCDISGELTIYNRWGRPVFVTKEVHQTWNGLFQGQAQPTGTYIYTLRYRFGRRQKQFTQNGTLHLIR